MASLLLSYLEYLFRGHDEHCNYWEDPLEAIYRPEEITDAPKLTSYLCELAATTQRSHMMCSAFVFEAGCLQQFIDAGTL
jgi:hypothetical protein